MKEILDLLASDQASTAMCISIVLLWTILFWRICYRMAYPKVPFFYNTFHTRNGKLFRTLRDIEGNKIFTTSSK